MSLMILLGRRSTLLSLLEMLLFSLITAVYFVLVAFIYAAIAQAVGKIELQTFFSIRDWFASLPVWMWIVEGLGYLLLITIYWTPGDEPANETELRAFAIFVAILLAIGGALLAARLTGVWS
jgi:hypothetical protein